MAKKGKMLVLANAPAGKDAEFNIWCNTVHAEAVKGLTGVKRYQIDLQLHPKAASHEFKDIVVYDMDDVDAANAEMAEAFPKMNMSDSADFLSCQMEEIFTYRKKA